MPVKKEETTPAAQRNTTSPSRSPSPQYSDSFESIPSPQKQKPSRRKVVTKPLGSTARGGPSTVRTHPYLGQQHRIKQPRNIPSNSTARSHTPELVDEAVKRLLSSRSRQINDLLSQISMLKQTVSDLRSENRTLRTQSYRQEKALERIDNSQTEMPAVLSRQEEEVKMLREQLRRQREQASVEADKRKELETTNAKYKQHLIKLKELTEDKHLQERAELQQKVTSLEADLDEKNRKISDLEKYVENLQKNYKRDLTQELQRHKQTLRTKHEMAQALSRAQELLKEKEKQLELQNIYTQKLRSRGLLQPNHEATNGSQSNLAMNSSPQHMPVTGPSPRERIMSFDRRRRNADRNKKQHSLGAKPSVLAVEKYLYEEDPTHEATYSARTYDAGNGDVNKSLEDSHQDTHELQSDEEHAEESVPAPPPEPVQSASSHHSAGQEEKTRRAKQREQQEAERLARENELIAKMEADKAEKRRREDFERQERERQEDERIRQEFAEKERRQRQLEEEQRRAQIEERRRKDELLRLLASVDNNIEEAEKERKNSPAENGESSSPQRRGTTYTFSEKVENLHQGKPTVNTSASTRQSTNNRTQRASASTEQALMMDLFGEPHDSNKTPNSLLIDENQNASLTSLGDSSSSFRHPNTFTPPQRTNAQVKKSTPLEHTHSEDLEELVL